ncbi:malto-oligosyltrehalose trehalohydrolase [Autumnicola psychrophila]|uniref:Malto-oligosyltrehalose trehalohydrolase n=1 Tax=Autumnicola psychrophila TaxID=3075592 RepID=A0ABU3DQT0_9FLAO|nr:malto-oligosyltrehalose trehalohydrolase [Zunongwangia sp. F225]MDT0685874.1 malto-oligosyltrehalose trehalohydrolase [Zunongwangia sp. F225]
MQRKVGAHYVKDEKCQFRVWAPSAKKVEVVVKNRKNVIQLEKEEKGYWSKELEGIPAGSYYKFRLNKEKEFPDPASKFQPEGVHSWSQVIDPEDYQWNDKDWKGLPMSQMIIYELHVGTFTKEGTFAAIEEKLDYLLELGITAIEIMPISAFPGNRNWGYDGVYPYATQESYGTVKALKKLIDSCHKKEIAVILDAVYNHMGPEGNYLAEFGPYFTDKYTTPWGKAINFDDRQSDHVRNFFLQSALMWLKEFHFDGLRLDAIHEIIDRGAKHLLKELSEQVDKLEEETGRKYVLIAESDLNDTKIINEYKKGGFGLEAQWVDDFHHSLHTLITGENEGYYNDYGKMANLGKSLEQAFVYDGIYSNFRKRTIGNSPKGLPSSKFVVCIQNHDQVGNRMLGDRLSQLVSFEKLKLAAGVMLTSSFVPMLFMGEEFAEDQVFQYFVSHGDPELVKAVQEGRKREFEYFNHHGGEFPDPQSEETFNNSKLNWSFQEEGSKMAIFGLYKELIRLRKEGAFQAFYTKEKSSEADEENKTLRLSAGGLTALYNFSEDSKKMNLPEGEHQLVFASADKKWSGPQDFPQKVSGAVNIPPESLIICKS